jgi:hypothetical protein
MVLKDFECEICGMGRENLAEQGETSQQLYCRNCSETTTFFSVCNGGTGVRYRFADLPEDPRFYRGQARASAPVAHDSSGKATEHSKGGLMHSDPRFSDDARQEKREKIYHETDTKRGYNKLYFS